MGLMCDCVDHVSRMYNTILDVSVSQDQGRYDTGSHTILGRYRYSTEIDVSLVSQVPVLEDYRQGRKYQSLMFCLYIA